MPPGGGRFDLPDDLLPRCWRDKPTGTTDVMGRMRWDQPSLTIRTEFFKPEKGQYLHPQWEPDPARRVNRVITHLEAALLQQFPDDVPLVRLQDRDRQADRQRGAGRPRRGHRRTHPALLR